MDNLDTFTEILPFFIPLLILQLALMIVALVDLIKRQRVRGDNKVLWALLIVLVNIIGPVVYLIFGRED
jgi:hypothetical protein